MFGLYHQFRLIRHVAGFSKPSLETTFLARQLAVPSKLQPAFKAVFFRTPACPLSHIQWRPIHTHPTARNASPFQPRGKPTPNPSQETPLDPTTTESELPDTLTQRAENILRNKRIAAEWSRAHTQALLLLIQRISSDPDPSATLAILHSVDAMCKEMARQSGGKLPHDIEKVAKLVDKLIPRVRAQTGTARRWWRKTLGGIAWGPTILINLVIAMIFS